MTENETPGAVPDNTERIKEMDRRLNEALQPARLAITDDSHKHVGHPGARDGRGHFTVDIESEAFRGRSPVARHRLVYDALGDLMETDIHALAIRASAPED